MVLIDELEKLLDRQGGRFAKAKNGKVIPINEAAEGDTIVMVSGEDVKAEKIMMLFGKEKINTPEYRRFLAVVKKLEGFVNASTPTVIRNRVNKKVSPDTVPGSVGK